jgi:hypothetical protein
MGPKRAAIARASICLTVSQLTPNSVATCLIGSSCANPAITSARRFVMR